MRSSIWPRVRETDAFALLLGAGLSLAGALALTASPRETALALLVLAAVTLALARPAILFAFAVALLAFEPAKILHDGSSLGRPETFKLVLYACTVPLLLDRGLDRRKCAPLLAYLLVTVLSEAFGTRLPGLTTSQTVASLATLSLGWIVFALRWNWSRDQMLLKVLALVPATSVLSGLVLQAAGQMSLFRHTSPPRLQGATIAAWLATLGFCAVLACVVLARRRAWRHARTFAVINVLIVAVTLTRGALLALVVMLAPAMLAWVRRQTRRRGPGGVLRLVALLICATVAAAALLPGLRARNEDASVLVAGHGSHEIASGRFQAWDFAYQRAKVNLAFGRGVGAGPVVGRTPGSPVGFTAQHNEYVRMLLEVGVIGGVILLAAIVLSVTGVLSRAPAEVRGELTAAAIAFALYSVTENTLSATPLAVAFLLAFSLGASRAGERTDG